VTWEPPRFEGCRLLLVTNPVNGHTLIATAPNLLRTRLEIAPGPPRPSRDCAGAAADSRTLDDEEDRVCRLVQVASCARTHRFATLADDVDQDLLKALCVARAEGHPSPAPERHIVELRSLKSRATLATVKV